MLLMLTASVRVSFSNCRSQSYDRVRVRVSPGLGLAECSVSKAFVSCYHKKVSKKKSRSSALPVNVRENTKKIRITMSVNNRVTTTRE